jgi:Protein of unknown function (DUF664)
MPATGPEWRAPELHLPDEPFTGLERPMLDGFLDRYRASLLRRCSGLTGDQLVLRPVPPSNLSLLGIVRHLTDVERTYFRIRWGGQDIACCYATASRPDAAFEDLDPRLAQRDLERLVAEQDLARAAIASLQLEATFVNERWGAMSLRWALTHIVAEYSGHIGQADLIRERIDGRTRW